MGDERVEVGGLAVTVPAAWQARPDAAAGGGRAWALPAATGGEALLALTPVGEPPRGASIEERLRAAGAPLAAAAQATVGAPRAAAVGQVPALVAPLAAAGGAVGLVAAAVAGPRVVLVTAAFAGRPAAQAVDAVLASARGAFPPREAPPPAGAPAALELAGATLLYPAGWRAVPGAPAAFVGPAQAHLQAPLASGALVDVVVEVQPGAPVAPRAGLAAWAREAAALLGRTWGPSAKVTVASAEDFTFGDGSLGATVVVQERGERGPEAGVVAHARTSRGLTAWAAAAVGPWAPGWRATPQAVAAERRWRALDEAAAPLVTVLACLRPRPLQAPRREVEAQLAARGRWERVHRWRVISGAGTPYMTSASGHDRITWTFAADGGCAREAEDSAGFMAGGLDLQGLPWSGSGVLDDPGTRRAGRYEVRAPLAEGGPLLLVVTEPLGRVRVHALALDAPGDFGRSRFRGLAIDGLHDGRYESGSNDTGEYRFRDDTR